MGQWQQDFEDAAFLFQWLLVSLKEFIAFAFNAPVVLKIFQRLYIQECGKELGSLGCHCHSLSVRFFMVFQVKLVWVVSAFRPSRNPTKLRPLDLVLFVETGNRACLSLSLHAKQKRATIEFQMPTLVFAF